MRSCVHVDVRANAQACVRAFLCALASLCTPVCARVSLYVCVRSEWLCACAARAERWRRRRVAVTARRSDVQDPDHALLGTCCLREQTANTVRLGQHARGMAPLYLLQRCQRRGKRGRQRSDVRSCDNASFGKGESILGTRGCARRTVGGSVALSAPVVSRPPAHVGLRGGHSRTRLCYATLPPWETQCSSSKKCG